MAAGQFRHQVGGRRRHHDEIGFAREPNVADVEFTARVEQIGEHALADDGAGRQRRDEMLGRFGENAAHGDAALLQAPDEVERLVGGDAAADDQQHALAIGGRHGCLPALKLGAGLARAAGCRNRVAFGGGAPQDGAHLVLDRAAVARRAQPQLLLQGLVELPDGQ